MTTRPIHPPVAGLVLAGGLSRRMGGGDKPLIEIQGQSMLARVIDRLAPQVGPLLLNANGDAGRFAGFGLPVLADVVEGYGGPLVGVLTGLEWLRDHAPDIEWMISVAADTPLFPTDLVTRLTQAAREQGADIAMACTGRRSHPVFALWPVRLAAQLRHAVIDEGMRKIEAWTDRYTVAMVDWPATPTDPFFNVNTPEDVERLRMILDGSQPAEPPLAAAREVAVVVERRDGATSWVKEVWTPREVIADPPAEAPAWVLLRRQDGGEHYLASGCRLALHRSDLASYRYNLAGNEPRLYVALRPTGEEGPPVKVALVTAAPDEAQAFSESGDDVVDGVAMPAELRRWIERFCACHPPDEPMRKRKRDSLDVDGAFAAKAQPS